MSIHPHRFFTGVAAGLLIAAGVVSSASASQPVAASSATFTITGTFKGAVGKTLLVVANTGRVVGESKITKATQKVTVKTKGVSTLKGATLQMVTSSGGDYFGPVILNWKGTAPGKATRVFMSLKSTGNKVNLGEVGLKNATASKKQGFARVRTKLKLADVTAAKAVTAVAGKPVGVGTYGKGKNTKASSVQAFAPGDPCSPPNTPTCSPDGRELAPPTGNPPAGGTQQQPVNGAQPGQPQPNAGQSGSTTVDETKTDGADTDGDGIINAFDVNDDGDKDATVDSADADTPKVKISGTTTGANCEAAASFRIFTNFKATQPGYAGTINAYGSGAFEATDASIASAIGKTMSMVFSPITSVCGSAVTATYLKGVGVPYAPADFVKLGAACNTGDYQWMIGTGFMCGMGSAGGSSSGFKFSDGYTFTGTDLPSGQDTFIQKVETADGNSYEFVASAGFVFVTHPMIASYSTDGTTFTNIDYSKAVSGPDGASVPNVKISLGKAQTLTLKVYRPQRLAIDGETGKFYDLGGFRYVPDLPNQVGVCDALATADADMASDTAADTTTKPFITLSWAIGSKCYGVAPKNATWPTGEMQGGIDIQVTPTGPGGNSAQKLYITAVS
jgi:hypothetical protein